MNIRKKSKAIKELEKIRGKALTFKDLLNSTRLSEEMTQREIEDQTKETDLKLTIKIEGI